MKTIFVVEDNHQINEILTSILKKEGYKVFPFYNAFEALAAFRTTPVDCIVTDLMLPIMSGEEFIQEIRLKSSVHIIIISAKTESKDKLKGLQVGADDYIYKPFLEQEVILKIRNLFKKQTKISTYQTFNNGVIKFEEGKPSIILKEKEIKLTAVEYRMMKLLLDNANKVVTRDQFLNELYQFNEEVYDRVIDVHIRNIRKKITKHYDKELIKTVYGLGYSFEGVLDNEIT